MRATYLEMQNFAFGSRDIILPNNFLNFSSHFQAKFSCFVKCIWSLCTYNKNFLSGNYFQILLMKRFCDYYFFGVFEIKSNHLRQISICCISSKFQGHCGQNEEKSFFLEPDDERFCESPTCLG